MSTYDRDRRFFKTIRLSKINAIEDIQLPGFTVRVLQWIVRFLINKEMGKTVTKAGFGKYPSEMNKAELIHAIWYVRDTILKCPRNVKWYNERHSYRISSCSYEDFNGKFLHVVYIGFSAKEYHNAIKMQSYLQSKKLAELVSLRRSKRSAKSLKYELKIWGINPEILKGLIKKDLESAAADAKKLVCAKSWEEVCLISNAWSLDYKVEVNKHLKNFPEKYEIIKSWKNAAKNAATPMHTPMHSQKKNDTMQKDDGKAYFNNMFGYQREEFPRTIESLQSLIDTVGENVGGNLILKKVQKQCQKIGYQIVTRGGQLKVVDPQEF